MTNAIDFTSDSSHMVSAGNYGHAILNSTADWQQIGDGLIPKTSSIKSVRFSPDTRLIAAGYGRAKCIAVFSKKDISLVKHLPLFYLGAVAWTTNGSFLMVSGRDEHSCLRVFRTADWRLVGSPKVQADLSNIEYIDVYGDLVAVAGEDAHVRKMLMYVSTESTKMKLLFHQQDSFSYLYWGT